ncbi:hypothetical protein AVEN_123106-1 [Araneus ventricosus]|uniref:Uncharacterized protein n=1 Tax=Araneus ventricosus TaxID=182803 RepID=A0A4Y2L4T6_ARAVE|nr:hypothetical protein AVEN_123106-1 [Araneus ventricosus]
MAVAPFIDSGRSIVFYAPDLLFFSAGETVNCISIPFVPARPFEPRQYLPINLPLMRVPGQDPRGPKLSRNFNRQPKHSMDMFSANLIIKYAHCAVSPHQHALEVSLPFKLAKGKGDKL